MKGNNKHFFQIGFLAVLLGLLTPSAMASVRVESFGGTNLADSLSQRLVEIEEKQQALESRSHEVYREQLLRLMERATESGNLVAYIHASDEFKRFEREAPIPEQHESAVLHRFLRTCHGKKKQAAIELQQNRVSIANQLHGWYKKQEVALMKQERIGEAKQMRAAQEALQKRMRGTTDRV